MWFIATILAAGLAAQSPMMAPWWEGPIVRDLNLSEAQNRQIRTTVAGSRSKIILLRAYLEAAEVELAELMGNDPVDPKKGHAAIEKVLTARTELGRQVAQMSLSLRQILTAQQWHELERRQQPRQEPTARSLQLENKLPNHPDVLRSQAREGGGFWQVLVVPQADAETAANALRGKGFSVQLRPIANTPENVFSRHLVRVLVGPFPDAGAMEVARAQLERDGYRNAIRTGAQ